jgi:hypothetical protein
MWKIILPVIIIALTFYSCKKEKSNLEESSFLEVEQKNMGVVAKRTATWCGPCGGWGFDYFDQLKLQFQGKAVFMAFKTAFDIPSTEGHTYYSRVQDLFDIEGGTPKFFYNFDTIHGYNYSGENSVVEHVNSEVVANSNYEFSLSSETIHLKTTTKFFQSTEGEYVISPFLILDNQIGNQLGNDDAENTVHPRFVANLARPLNTDIVEPWAYKVASGTIDEGYRINLEFEVERDPEWTQNDISFALILYKREGNKYKFVNAFTK